MRQGDIISPKLFTLVLEDMSKTLDWDDKGINIDVVRLSHLRFTDDIVLISTTERELKREEMHKKTIQIGLKMNFSKTKV